MATQLYRLLPLLFLPTILFCRGASPPLPSPPRQDVGDDPGLYPVVLLPGNTCSQLEARISDEYQPPSPQCAAAKGNGRWFLPWKNSTAMQDPELAPCLADQLRLVYDPVTRDFRNVPGVESGDPRRRLRLHPRLPRRYSGQQGSMPGLGRLVEALEQAGYHDGETLFGAPFDFRQAPAAPGQPCRAVSQLRRRLRALVQDLDPEMAFWMCRDGR